MFLAWGTHVYCELRCSYLWFHKAFAETMDKEMDVDRDKSGIFISHIGGLHVSREKS